MDISVFAGIEQFLLRTISTSQMKQYFGSGGISFETPIVNDFTSGCLPAAIPSISSWKAEMADLWLLIVGYSHILSN